MNPTDSNTAGRLAAPSTLAVRRTVPSRATRTLRSKKLTLAIALIDLCWCSLATAGTPSVDQAQLAGDQTIAIHPTNYISQTFTSQVAGFLSGVEVSLSIPVGGQSIRVEVWSSGLRVGLISLEAADLGPFQTELVADQVTGTYIDFTPFAIPTAPGQVMEVQFHMLFGDDFASIRRDTQAGYPDGTATNNGGPVPNDLTFKTFVEQSVPLGDFDHFQPDGYSQSMALRSDTDVGQTLTVVGSGRLRGLELSLTAPARADDDLTMELYRHTGGGPALLGSVLLTPEHINAADDPRFLHHAQVLGTYVDLTSLNATVSAGDMLEFRFTTSNTVGCTQHADRLPTCMRVAR